jgi:conjugative relaxase-like TrwC/TraI family protein
MLGVYPYPTVMLSIRGIAKGSHYLSYVEKESAGKWTGSGAKLLKLPEDVNKEDFKSVRLGVHPVTEEPLRSHKLVDRVYRKPWGLETYKTKELYDLTISAPKSVSIMALVDPRISTAHEQSVERVLQGMEERNGAMVVAEFHHRYSRKLDPQIHSHLVAGNLSFDGEKWHALGANNLYRGQKEITAGYRDFLLRKLEQDGYRIEYPEIAGVPEEVIAKFSQRSRQRDEAIEQFVEYQGKNPTNREIGILVRDNRDAKAVMPTEEVRERQLERLTPSEHSGLVRLREESKEKEVSYSYDLNDHITEEPAAHHQANWSYGGEKVKSRAF